MCIVLLTTAHPSYSLILIDNRDEFILRPTSRPHWWTPDTPQPIPSSNPTSTSPPSQPPPPYPAQQILSSRDLQRSERGTWLGVTRAGHLAVLTNFREPDSHAVSAAHSRGAIVSAWLGASPQESTAAFISRTLASGAVRGVGGFSLICGKLRRRKDGSTEPLAVLSNRATHAGEVPSVAAGRGEVSGLTNSAFEEGVPWRKLEEGKRLLGDVVERAVEGGWDEEGLVRRLFGVLDTDTLPVTEEMGFEECIGLLKQSIFVPLIGDAAHREAMVLAAKGGAAGERVSGEPLKGKAAEVLAGEQRPDQQGHGFMTGMYGTQRQTVMLVDWDGNVTYVERALWDERGIAIDKGEGDVYFRFKVEGWDDEETE